MSEELIMIVLDFGKNVATIYDSSTDTSGPGDPPTNCEITTHEAILELPDKLKPGDMVVSEYAHMGCPRRPSSLSQPFTDGELLELYKKFEEKNITFRLFPQQTTPNALDMMVKQMPTTQSWDNENKTVTMDGGRKLSTGEPDAKAIYLWLTKYPETCLMKPPKTFDIDPVRQEGWKRKERTNQILNFARRFGYADPSDSNSQWLKDNMETIASQLSDRAKDVFGLTERKKSGADKGNFKDPKLSQIYSVTALMRELDGSLRKRELTGELPGWEFTKKYVIGMSPFHRRGGVSRSNFYHHGAKHYISRKLDNKVLNENNRPIVKKRKDFSMQEERDFRYYRAEYSKAIKELFQVVKCMLQNDC